MAARGVTQLPGVTPTMWARPLHGPSWDWVALSFCCISFSCGLVLADGASIRPFLMGVIMDSLLMVPTTRWRNFKP